MGLGVSTPTDSEETEARDSEPETAAHNSLSADRAVDATNAPKDGSHLKRRGAHMLVTLVRRCLII